MANEEKRIWGIHTTDDALFLHNNVIAIGWKEFGDCSKLEPTREAYKAHYIKAYPNGKKGAIATSAGMLYRFALEMKVGDYVVFPSKSDRKINIGIVESDFIYEPSAVLYVQQRKVKWLKHLPRTAFSQGALYELGSALSFFMLKNYADEYLHALEKDFKPTAAMAEPDETIAATAEDIIESTRDFILKELSKKLKGYALEEFVSDLLRAMGYRCTVSPQGGDSGIDSRDGTELECPDCFTESAGENLGRDSGEVRYPYHRGTAAGTFGNAASDPAFGWESQRRSDGAVPTDADPGSEYHDFAVERPDTGVGATGWENERGIWESHLAGAGTDEAYFQNAVLDLDDPQPDLGSLGTGAAYLVADLTNIVDHRPVEDCTTKHYRPERKKSHGQSMGM